MKIVYYTSGLTGSGRIVRGISIGNALKRKRFPCEYTILSSSPFAFLAGEFNHIEIPIENDFAHLKNTYQNSILFKTLIEINPDIILIDILWFPLFHFLDKFNFKKIFLKSQVGDDFFDIRVADDKRIFRPNDYDRVINCEPMPTKIPSKQINPIIIRNKDEIFSRENAYKKLKVKDDRPLCLFAYNGEPGEFEKIKKKYSYLEDAEYQIIYSTNYSDQSYFPIVDYFNAFDFIVSGAGYNAFWEIIYFDKEAVFEPAPRAFEDQYRRIRECQEYYFDENGADQLVDIIMNL